MDTASSHCRGRAGNIVCGEQNKTAHTSRLLCCRHLPEAAPGAACSKHRSCAQEPQHHGAAQWGRAVGQGGLGGLGGFWGAPGGFRGCLWPSTAVTSSPGHALAPFIKHSPCPPSTQQGCGDLPTAWKRCHPSDRQPGVCVPTATPLLPSTFSDIGEAMI